MRVEGPRFLLVQAAHGVDEACAVLGGPCPLVLSGGVHQEI